ncbi:histidine kinase-like ATPase [Paraphysoderma sedebokerense]|nr:histidine kinase-like ATPase [Paraphysoderma sedebokerense]
MSHEIRTPISQVISAAEMLSETELTLDAKDHADIIIDSGKLLLNLVNDVLDFSKLESGKISIEEVEMNLFETIRITVEAFNTDKDVKIAYYMPQNLPQIVLGDSTRIRQITTNLVSNALKFTCHGYVLVKIDSKLIDETNVHQIYDVEFKVIDTGAGIAADRLQQIFERFEQEDVSTTRLHGGTGLGLTISQNLCQLMGSKIKVASALGVGSTFQFTIRFKSPKIVTATTQKVIRQLPRETRIILLQDPTNDVGANEIVEYQLTTMGAHVRRENFDSDISYDIFNCVIMDLTNSSKYLKDLLTQSQISRLDLGARIIILHRRTHDGEISTLLEKHKHIQAMCHPYKQSALFKIVSELLKVNRMDEAIRDLRVAQPLIENARVEGSSGRPDISILLVEDNMVNQKIMSKSIKRLGHEVDVAENGLVGLDLAKKKKYDLILMDVRMPVMDGLEATRLIRQHFESQELPRTSGSTSQAIDMHTIENADIMDNGFRTPYIVGLSADALNDNHQDGLDAGMDLYLTKPISKAKLTEIIDNIEKRM